MIDQWNEELRCPKCKKKGIASLSQPKQAEAPTVEAVPVGFKAVQTEFGPDFRCEACNIPAAP